ncbi:MAG: fasciclin domain-containing protein [Bacteroidaceae bacterium]|nr:fasciclin domain-containing protein [Bacteroidaceae bacterium]
MKRKLNRLLRLPQWAGVLMIATGGLSACSGYDLAEEDPSWLGSSIYDYLKGAGNYTHTVQMIDDLGYKDVLAKTGSKTLFVADDDAFNRFFQNNTWGVRKYSDLSEAQKKLLLYGSMINNSCQVAYLSSSEGPTEGDCMRRMTATSEYDSVPVLTPAQMPDNPYWARYREGNKSIVCMSDVTAPPMIHFIETFLNNKLITNEDCNFLFNYQTERQAGDANVNGIMMAEQNIKCSNGFVHRMAEVLTPLPNMADLINQKSNTQGYARLLNRFCAPYRHDKNDAITREYNRIYGTDIDTLYEKRYFSERSQGGEPLDLTPDEGPVNGLLKFDPAWNQFYSATTNSTASNVALQENMGVMLVPSDEALNRYWNEGAGKVLKDYYGSWENVPDKVISKMLNVNMLNSFTNSVPSKFYTVLNDANDELGLSTEFVDSVYMACNGAVYLTNKVFNPVAYISVTFPALINETMNILYWGVEQLGFDVYLNSQNTYYSLFIPNNKSLLDYVDPCSYGKTSTQLFRFHYKASAQTEREKVWASIWNYDPETGVVGDSIGEASYSQITNRLEDILNTHIVIGNVENGNTFFRTKGGSMVKVANAAAGAGGMTVQGGYQLEQRKSIPVVNIYDESLEGNGKTYIIDEEPIMTARKSVFDILDEHEEFEQFRNLLQSSQFLETKHVIGSDEHGEPSPNISLFNTYRYTVYVPTNQSILDLQKDGKLPTWEQVEQEEDEEVKDSLRTEIENFIKYHIQDEAFYMGQGSDAGEYETSAYKITDGNLSYYKLQTAVENGSINITDGVGNTHKVVTADGLYNLMAREYQYDTRDATSANNLYTSSFAVIHQIDGVLQYK